MAVLLLALTSVAWSADAPKVFTSFDDNYEGRLEQAAASGYVLWQVFPIVTDVDISRPNPLPGSGRGAAFSEALMFVLRPGAEHASYKVVMVDQLVGGEKRLNAAGAEGYRINASDAYMLRRWDMRWQAAVWKYALVLVRDPGRAYEFRVVDGTKRGFGEQVSKSQAEGFELVQYLGSGVFLLQREKGAKKGAVSHFAVAQGDDTPKIQQALNDSGAKGFAVRYITTSDTGIVMTVISEQQPVGQFQYRIFSSTSVQKLQQGVSDASKEGFCVLPSGVFATQSRRELRPDRNVQSPPGNTVILMEKRSGAPPCGYDVQLHKSTSDAMTAIAQMAGRGQRVVGISSTALDQVVVAHADH